MQILDTKPRVFFFLQAGFGAAFTYLTTGAFLTGLALLMGAGDVLASYLSVIVNICGVLILAFAAFLERFQSRKRLTIALTALSRLATLFIVTIPAFTPKGLQLLLFIPAVILAFALQSQTTVVLNQWMVGFVDEKKNGRYISLRQTMNLLVTVALSLTSGSWMDSMGGRYIGFVLLFAFAGFMGLCELFLLSRIPDGEPYHSANRACRLRDIAWLPLKNRRFTGFVLYILVFYLLLTVSDSFTTVFMMKYLELPYRTVTAMSLIFSLPQIVLLGIWGKISDRLGHEFVLKASVWLFAGQTLFLFFSSPKSWRLFLPLAFLAAAVSNAGFVISVFNRRYELMPRENRIVYDNFYTAVIGLGSIFGPMVGGLIKSGIENNPVTADAFPLANIRLLYLISTVGLLLLQTLNYCAQRKRRDKNVVKTRCAYIFHNPNGPDSL